MVILFCPNDRIYFRRKKRDHEVMWNGSFYTNASRYMENNIAMLFLTLYFSRYKNPDCCCLTDILKLVKDRVIPYICIERFIPPDLFFVNDQSYHSYLRRDHAPSWNYMSACFHKVFRDMKFNFLIKCVHTSLISMIN